MPRLQTDPKSGRDNPRNTSLVRSGTNDLRPPKWNYNLTDSARKSIREFSPIR